MRALFSPTFRLLRNDQPFINATVIFLITTLFYFVGAMLRLGQALYLCPLRFLTALALLSDELCGDASL